MLRATLCALLVLAATPLGAQEQKQPQAPRPAQTDVALALVLADHTIDRGYDDAVDRSGAACTNCRVEGRQRRGQR